MVERMKLGIVSAMSTSTACRRTVQQSKKHLICAEIQGVELLSTISTTFYHGTAHRHAWLGRPDRSRSHVPYAPCMSPSSI